MKASILERLERGVVELIRRAAMQLPPDVEKALKEAYRRERGELGRRQLEAILRNVERAEETGRPLCQDTGLISFYVKGSSVDVKFRRILERAVVRATRTIPLRPSTVHPLTRRNPGNNLGEKLPEVLWDPSEGEELEVTVVLKGAGSENSSVLYVLPPEAGERGLKKAVLEAVVRAGGQPCPPTIINLGVGGTVSLAFKLAKLALVRPLGRRHPLPGVARLERELLRLVNRTGVGPMGLGGSTTSLDVKIEYAHSHTASLPLAVNFQCWADRRASMRVGADGSIEIL